MRNKSKISVKSGNPIGRYYNTFSVFYIKIAGFTLIFFSEPLKIYCFYYFHLSIVCSLPSLVFLLSPPLVLLIFSCNLLFFSQVSYPKSPKYLLQELPH